MGIGGVEKQKALDNFPKPVTIEGTIKILNQLQNCICKIENPNGNGTGFFCSINEKLKVLITNNHIINEDIIKYNNKLKVSINDDKENKIIELSNKKIYTSIEYDTTIIEINPKKENINNFLELDEQIFKDSSNINKKSVYILQYPNFSDGQKASVSYGTIKGISEKFNILHFCNTEKGSSGSPIINLLNHKLIGIHKKSFPSRDYNIGSFLKYPINEYLEKFNISTKNEINITVKIEEKDINQNIYFLNYDLSEKVKESEFEDYKISTEYFDKLLEESKIDIFINDEKYENKRYFQPKEIGEYNIKLEFKTGITNMSCMFCACENIINIDFSGFDTSDVTNMIGLFCGCFNLTKLDLSHFDTRNVKHMNRMFIDCFNLIDINLSSFDTKNVINMQMMFSYCRELKYLDLSSFDTKNVEYTVRMFVGTSLETVKINNINLNENIKKQLIQSECNIIDVFGNKMN